MRRNTRTHKLQVAASDLKVCALSTAGAKSTAIMTESCASAFPSSSKPQIPSQKKVVSSLNQDSNVDGGYNASAQPSSFQARKLDLSMHH